MVVHSAETRKSDAKDLVARDAVVHDMLRGSKSKCLTVTSLIFNFVMLLMLFGAGYYLCRYRQEICEMRVQNDVENFEALGVGYEVKGCDVHAVESKDDANPVKDPIAEFADMGKKPAYQSSTPRGNKTLLRRRRPSGLRHVDQSDLEMFDTGEKHHKPSSPHEQKSAENRKAEKRYHNSTHRGHKTTSRRRRPNQQQSDDQSDLDISDMGEQEQQPSNTRRQKTPHRRRRPNGLRRGDKSSLESADMTEQEHQPSTSSGEKTPPRWRRLNGKGRENESNLEIADMGQQKRSPSTRRG